MVSISQELTDFKSKLEGKLSSISSTCSTITSKLSSVTSACNEAKGSISQNYQSDAVAVALSSFESIAKVITNVNNSITGTVTGVISDANSLISDITKLEELKEEIEELEKTLNNTPNDDDHKSTRSSLQSKITEKENDFKTKHEDALTKLAALKSKDDQSLVVKNGSGDTSTGIDGLEKTEEITVTGGTLEKYTYKANNGVTVSYYMYVPKTTSDTKLPVCIYFHGLNEIADKYPDRGPYGLIKSGKLTPKGIVIFPQADNGTKDSDFHKANYEEAVMELTRKVCESCNGDVKRLSVAGHSNGACAVGHIVANYPGVFAAAAPISGVTSGSEGMNQTNLWSFRGSYDTPNVDRTAKNIISKGGKNAHYTVWPKKGHAVQAYTFEQTIQDEKGNNTTLMDWLMSKSTA